MSRWRAAMLSAVSILFFFSARTVSLSSTSAALDCPLIIFLLSIIV
jgi:hypothetical protein